MNFENGFDSITAEQLRADGSFKWNASQCVSANDGKLDALGMWLAEMDFGLAPAIQKVLHTAAESSGIGYPCPILDEELREAALGWYQKAAETRFDASVIYNVPNVLCVLELMLQKVLPAGVPVVVPTPAYMPMLTIPPKYGHPVIQVPAMIRDGRYCLDLEGIDAAFRDQGAGLLILVNPWNPTGRVLSKRELIELDGVMARYPEARVFVDEIHVPLVLEGQFTSYASISENSARQSFTAFAPTKGWNMPGLRVGHTLITREDDKDLLNPELELLHSLIPTLGMKAGVAAYRESLEWLNHVLDYVRANRDCVEDWLERDGARAGVSAHHVEGTYIAWLDFSQAQEQGRIPSDVNPAQWLQEKTGVVLTMGGDCGDGFSQCVRMILATPRPILKEALNRIADALSD